MGANFNPEEAAHKYNLKVMDIDAAYKLRRLEAGWIGIIFGTGKNAPINVAGITLCVVLFVGIIASLIGHNPIEMWKVIAPIITLVMGFVFGKIGEKPLT